MKCIVIDDDIIQHHILASYINDTEGIQLVRRFENPIEGLSFLKKNKVDLVFLDVEMPDISGLEIMEKFRPQSNIILITSNKNYAIDGFNNDVQDFLLKPFSYKRFLRAISKVRSTGDNPFIIVKSNGSFIKIYLSDLQWIQSASEYLLLYTKNGKEIIYSTMKEFLDKLPDNFIQVHRSNIVNLDAIDLLKGSLISIGNHEIKVSRSYKGVLKERMAN